MGAVVETPAIYLDMTAEDNLRQQALVIGLPNYDSIPEILRLVGLEGTGKKRARNFSLGMTQRLGIAVALIGNPDFLILDEPTAVLTPQETQKLFAILRRMRDDGKAIIIITHKMHEVLSLSDRVSVLRKGEYIGVVNTKDATESSLTEMMVGKKVELNIDRAEPKDSQPRLEVKGIRCPNRQGNTVLHDVSFDIRYREIVGLVGESGSGKSVFVKTFMGLLDANGWTLRMILNTHSHADHIGGNQYLQKQTGCLFAPRCEFAQERCFREEPELREVGEGCKVRCFRCEKEEM